MVVTSSQDARESDDATPASEIDVGHELGNVALLLDAVIRLTPQSHETIELLSDAKRRVEEISRSVGPG